MRAQQGAYTFNLELDSPLSKGDTVHPLVDFLPKSMKKEGLSALAKLVEQKAEAVWVQSRLMVVLGFTPAEGDKASLLNVTFRCSDDPDDEDQGVRFSCAQHEGRAVLFFNKSVKKELAKKVATAFWKLLLAEPSELDDFTSEMTDASGARVACGVRDGCCFCGDEEEDVDLPSVGTGRGPLDFDPVGMEDEDDWISGGRFDDDDEDDPFGDDDDGY